MAASGIDDAASLVDAPHIGAPPAARRAGAWRFTAPLFTATLFSSAALIFMLQPLFARLVTPLLGGSPAVWNTSMVFFQTALLLGYCYAHLLQRVPVVTRQVAIHAAVLGLAALALPLAPSTALGAADLERPARWLLGVLALSVGVPYMAAAATAPLLQAWYARTGRPDAADPYFLYGASNLGSLLGLLAYPTLVEPLVGVRAQAIGWSWAYAAVAVLIVSSGWVAVLASRAAHVVPGDGVAPGRNTGIGNGDGAPGRAEDIEHGDAAADAAPRSSALTRWRERFRWTAAAAIPSGLLIAVTQHIVTDLASAPFLWVPPLVLYLLTFVIAFRKRAGPTGPLLLGAHALVVVIVVVLPRSASIAADVAIRLATLFTSALVCHRALATTRPPVARLTEFYNCVSLGGVIGGATTALLAPVVFDTVVEYPLLLAATFLLLPRMDTLWRPAADTAVLAGAAAIVFAFTGWLPVERPLLGIVGATVFLNRARAWVAAPLVFATMLLVAARGMGGEEILRDRTFFGSHRVLAVGRPLGVMHLLMHGSTMHGAQWRDSTRQRAALTYYAEGSSLSEAVRAALPVPRPAHAGLIGLGSGAMACVLRDGDTATFIEIDPAIVAVAQDPRYFTYLESCPRNTRVLVGDGRLEMGRLPPATLDVVLVDAFSSDAIPAHLLTREALRVYMRALRDDGALVLHVSNRHLAVVNEAVRVGAAEGLAMRHWRSPTLFTESTTSLESPSVSAVVLTRTEAAMERLQLGAHWTTPSPLPGRPWTDDFIDLIRPLRERPMDSLATAAVP